MAQYGSKDFSTLDRNAAIVNDVLRTRLEYEAARAKSEKERWAEQERASAVNDYAKAVDVTHKQERFVPGETPGSYKKEEYEAPGPEPQARASALARAAARIARAGDPNGTARLMLEKIDSRISKEAEEPKPFYNREQAVKPGTYTIKQQDVGGRRFYVSYDTTTGEQKVLREGDIPADAAFKLAEGDGRTLGLIIDKDGTFTIRDLGKATEKSTGARTGGIGSGADRVQDIVTWRGRGGAQEDLPIRGFGDEDAMDQIRAAKKTVEGELRKITGRTAKMKVADLREKYKFDDQQLNMLGWDGKSEDIFLSINLDGIMNKDDNVSAVYSRAAEAIMNQLATDTGENAEYKAEVEEAFRGMANAQADLNKWIALVAKEREGMKRMSMWQQQQAQQPAAGAPAGAPAAAPASGTTQKAVASEKSRIGIKKLLSSTPLEKYRGAFEQFIADYPDDPMVPEMKQYLAKLGTTK